VFRRKKIHLKEIDTASIIPVGCLLSSSSSGLVEVLSKHLDGGTEKDHENPQSLIIIIYEFTNY
jgi:hypothetical protein